MRARNWRLALARSPGLRAKFAEPFALARMVEYVERFDEALTP